MIHVLTLGRPKGTGRDLLDALYDPGPVTGYVNWTGRKIRTWEAGRPDVLNSSSRTDKLFQLEKLLEGGVPVPAFWTFGGPLPEAFGEAWVPRTRFHQQGRDFTSPIRPDYWVRKLSLDDEWRLHFFKTKKGNLRLLRSGLKLPKAKGFHPWVKSHRLGWKISYVGGAPGRLVECGRKAMEVLGLDFGAVDCAITTGLNPVVLEVNTCPGLDSGTLALYVASIKERFS